MSTLATDLIREFQTYRVSSGQDEGELVRLMPWQKTFIRRVFADGVQTAALTMGRGGGKSSSIGMICASALSGRLHKRGSEVVVVSSSMKQSRIIFQCVLGYLDVPMDRKRGRKNTDRYSVRDNPAEMSITDLEANVCLRLLGSDPRRAAGLQSSLLIGDEGSSWLPGYGEKMHNILLTSLGKVPGSRYIGISTRPVADENHWFERFLKSADVGLVYAADREDDPGSVRTWKKAIPSLSRFPELHRTMKREWKEAQTDIAALQRFKSLRLNMGVADTYSPNLVCESQHWEAIEVETLPAPEGRRIIGIDLADGVALNAAVIVWENGRMEAVAVFPEEPNLEDREVRDGCTGVYSQMYNDGDLQLVPGKHVRVKDFLSILFERWGVPSVIVADRYRQTELAEALRGYRVPVELRGVGFYSATEDLRRFRKRVLSGWPKVLKTLLWRWCLSNARTVSNPSGDEKLAKTSGGASLGRSYRGRDDCAAAAILALAHADRVWGERKKRTAAGWKIW